MLVHRQGMAGYSEQGDVTSRFTAKGGVHGLAFCENKLAGLLRNRASVFSINLSSGDRKKAVFKDNHEDLKLISIDPFLVAGLKTLYRLDDSLAIVDERSIRSPEALFFADHDRVYEIIRGEDVILCYDERQTLWRYTMDKPLREWALTENGLVLLFKDCLRYMPLRKASEAHQPHFSQYLEI